MTDRLPGFSVIIPVWNGEKHIGRAIRSCLSQTLLPSEIIVIDDASTDQTRTEVEKIDSARIVYRRNKYNSGPSHSRNAGMALAKYDWILFLDADDVFHEQKIEVIRYAISENDAMRAIGHAFGIQSGNKFFLPAEWKLQAGPVRRTVEQVLKQSPAVTPALAVRADNLLRFDEGLRFAEDHDFILRTTEQYGFWFIDLPLSELARLPLTPGGISSDRWKMRKGEIRMYINYAKRNGKVFYIPFLVGFSLLKHLRNLLFLRR